MLRPSVLVLALALSSRAWWGALMHGQPSLLTALIWFIVAVPVAGLMLAGLRMLTSSYRRDASKSRPPNPPS
jgi:hypothetical protein